MSDDELITVISQLERKSQNDLDKYKRWEAEQKLKLARAEQRRRNPINRIWKGITNLFD
ncbi:MAG: hypothetical protein AAFQ07_02705 [Chloroflexota bacterium]